MPAETPAAASKSAADTPIARPRETPRRKGRARSHRSEPPKAPAVQVHAHRGGAALAPENTMAAFQNAVDMGAHFIELDVQRCASGELVVVHDVELSRLAGVAARVADLPLTELQALDVGSHFSPEFAGERIPTLVEVLESFRNQIRFNIETKEPGLRGDGGAVAVGRLITKMKIEADVIVSSFNPFALLRVGSACRVPLGLCYPVEGEGPIKDRLFRGPWAAPIVAAYALHPRETLVTRELVRKAHLRGLAINTWTVNDEARMRELCGLMVTGLITDRPDLGLQVTEELDPLRRKAPGLPADA